MIGTSIFYVKITRLILPVCRNTSDLATEIPLPKALEDLEARSSFPMMASRQGSCSANACRIRLCTNYTSSCQFLLKHSTPMQASTPTTRLAKSYRCSLSLDHFTWNYFPHSGTDPTGGTGRASPTHSLAMHIQQRITHSLVIKAVSQKVRT